MKQRLRTLAFLCLASGSLAGCSLFGSSPPEAASPPEPSAGAEDTARQSAGDGDEPRPYDRVITDEAESDEGLFITHRIGDRLYFEIPDSILGREMLLLGRTVEHSARTGFVSGGARMIVLWERRGERIVLRETLHEATADSTHAIWRQVSRMQRGPIVGAFDIEAFGADSAAVVEVTPLYTRPNEQMGSISELNRDRSWIESASSFPRNVEVEATQTGRIRGGSGGGSGNGSSRTRATALLHWSMMLLPDRPMRPRLHDRRIGFLNTDLVDYGRPEHRAEERRFIHRFRLEPSDTAAFRRGELVEPVEPIVFWVDPATPDWLKPWVIRGVEAWNEIFEEAGFRDAIRGELLPEDDPAYHLYDARYSVIHWHPSRVANATGGQVVDPRSGEILKGEVNMYHNVQNLLRNWYVIQTAPLDERARSLPLPDSLMGRLVEYVVTHEVGHSIGFPHNMKASAMYPPDSLRSEPFLRRMEGHVATLMDYSRFNYVAQPEDSIPPELLVPRVGPYDRFAVRWGYRPILDADSPDAERPTLDRWARAQDTIPWFRFTTTDAPNDPAALTNAVGDGDAVHSSTLALRNLERVMEMLIPLAERPGEDYAILGELYGEAVTQWSRYMGHVAAVVGGADSRERYGRGERFFPLDRKRQEEAVAFLVERAFRTPTMLIRPEILRRIEAEGVVARVRQGQAQVLQTLLSDSRLNRLIEYEAMGGKSYAPYTLAELMEEVRQGVWSELDASRVQIDVYRRNLQRAYLEVVEARLAPADPPSGRITTRTLDPRQSDVQPVLRGELRTLRDQAEQAASRTSDRMTRLHLEDVVFEVDRILKP